MEDKQNQTRGGEVPVAEVLNRSWGDIYQTYNSDLGLDKVPEGWLTSYQVAEKVKMSERSTRSMLTRAERAGDVEKRSYRVNTPRGPRVISHYKKVSDEPEE